MDRIIFLSVLTCLGVAINFSSEPIHKSLPVFLNYIPVPNNYEYMAISSNPGFSVNEINNKLNVWAEKNEVPHLFESFLANFTEAQDDYNLKLTTVMEKLQTLKLNVDDALKNGDKTKIQQRDVIDSLREDNEEEFEILQYIAKKIGHDYYADELTPKTYFSQTKLIGQDDS